GPDDDPAAEAVRRAGDLAERAVRPGEPGPGRSKPTPADLADAHALAAEALDALAAKRKGGPDQGQGEGREPEQAPPDGPRDPELAIDPDHAARARELARRERRLRER